MGQRLSVRERPAAVFMGILIVPRSVSRGQIKNSFSKSALVGLGCNHTEILGYHEMVLWETKAAVNS